MEWHAEYVSSKIRWMPSSVARNNCWTVRVLVDVDAAQFSTAVQNRFAVAQSVMMSR